MVVDSWSNRHDAAREAAWGAVRRFERTSIQTPFAEIAGDVFRAIARFGEPVVAAVSANLDGEARSRIYKEAAIASLAGVTGALVEAIADELSRPEAMPFAAPPARSWVRIRRPARTTRRGRTEPAAWDGAWHAFSGDWTISDGRTQDVTGRALCGAHLRLRWTGLFDGRTMSEYVVADDAGPLVAACLRCLRIRDGSAAAEAASVERRRRQLATLP